MIETVKGTEPGLQACYFFIKYNIAQNMKSIREIFRMGYGPSSSHTMGPSRAAEFFKTKHPDAEKYRVTLYGSLALTGRGHGTDSVIHKVIGRPEATEIVWQEEITLPRHPNGMLLKP